MLDKASLTKLFESYIEAQKELQEFCREVATGLDWEQISGDVTVAEGQVNFMVEWYGPYQSYNYDHLTFPIDMLYVSVNEVVDYLKKRSG